VNHQSAHDARGHRRDELPGTGLWPDR
jgi:hypothetical protein